MAVVTCKQRAHSSFLRKDWRTLSSLFERAGMSDSTMMGSSRTVSLKTISDLVVFCKAEFRFEQGAGFVEVLQ